MHIAPKGNHIHKVMLAASTDALVHIQGEKGSGKEFTARMIHDQSHLIGDFVVLDGAQYTSGSIPETILQQGNGGTIFVKNLEKLSTYGQFQLVNILETRRDLKGAHAYQSLDARIVTGSDKSLTSLIQNGLFRDDFLERFKVIAIHLQPLRDRMDDFAGLTADLLSRMHHVNALHGMRLDTQAFHKLQEHDWGGNIKELESVLLRAAQNCRTGVIMASHIRFLEQ